MRPGPHDIRHRPCVRCLCSCRKPGSALWSERDLQVSGTAGRGLSGWAALLRQRARLRRQPHLPARDHHRAMRRLGRLSGWRHLHSRGLRATIDVRARRAEGRQVPLDRTEGLRRRTVVRRRDVPRLPVPRELSGIDVRFSAGLEQRLHPALQLPRRNDVLAVRVRPLLRHDRRKVCSGRRPRRALLRRCDLQSGPDLRGSLQVRAIRSGRRRPRVVQRRIELPHRLVVHREWMCPSRGARGDLPK